MTRGHLNDTAISTTLTDVTVRTDRSACSAARKGIALAGGEVFPGAIPARGDRVYECGNTLGALSTPFNTTHINIGAATRDELTFYPLRQAGKRYSG